MVPPEVVTIVEGRIRGLPRRSSGALISFSLLGTLWAASGGVSSLIVALNRVRGVAERRSFLRRRALALATTVGAGVLGLVAGGVAVLLPVLERFIGGWLGVVLVWLRLPVAGGIMSLVCALHYRFLPARAARSPRLFTTGAFVGGLGWTLASWLFSIYVRNFGSYEVTYGALAGAVVLLMWLWISAQALLLGAEVDKLLAAGPI